MNRVCSDLNDSWDQDELFGCWPDTHRLQCDNEAASGVSFYSGVVGREKVLYLVLPVASLGRKLEEMASNPI